ELHIIDPHQHLALPDGIALLHQDAVDDAAFERLHDLDEARGHNPARTALYLVENGEISPDDPCNEQSQARDEQEPGSPRRPQFHGGADFIGEREIRLTHFSISRPLWVAHRPRLSAYPAATPALCRAGRLPPAAPDRKAKADRQTTGPKSDASK